MVGLPMLGEMGVGVWVGGGVWVCGWVTLPYGPSTSLMDSDGPEMPGLCPGFC